MHSPVVIIFDHYALYEITAFGHVKNAANRLLPTAYCILHTANRYSLLENREQRTAKSEKRTANFQPPIAHKT